MIAEPYGYWCGDYKWNGKDDYGKPFKIKKITRRTAESVGKPKVGNVQCPLCGVVGNHADDCESRGVPRIQFTGDDLQEIRTFIKGKILGCKRNIHDGLHDENQLLVSDAQSRMEVLLEVQRRIGV